MKTLWLDANGHMHFSVHDALIAFDLPDTPENRKRIIEDVKKMLLELNPDQQILERENPDSEDYYKQKVPRCDHKFVDSNFCLKCGWNPDQP